MNSNRPAAAGNPDVVAETDFGYRRVGVDEKPRLVNAVFDSVAGRYDLMNDLMSLGVHRLWKRLLVAHAALRPGMQVLDLAGGTGDVAHLLARRVGGDGRVVMTDVNRNMLVRGRDRLFDHGIAGGVFCVLGDAQHLPFPDGGFECVTIAFGLRNITDKPQALAEMRRVLRPGGRALVLEFSELRVKALKPLYDLYSLRWLPLLGRIVADDAESYRYLAESIRRHPNQEDLKTMMLAAGFDECRYVNVSGGIAAVHVGYCY